jgi:hypothetical protein
MSKIDCNPAADPNSNIRVLHELIASAIEKNTTTKTVIFNKHKHKKSDWITTGILISIRFRDRMHLRLKRTKPDSPEYARTKTNLDTYNKILKKAIRDAKSLHLHKIFGECENDPKLTWQNINSLLNRNRKISSVFPENLKFEGTSYFSQE